MAAAAADVDSLRLDVQELENFSTSSSRPANQARLNKLLGELKAQLAAESSAAGASPDAQHQAAAAAADAEASAAAADPTVLPAVSSAGEAGAQTTRAVPAAVAAGAEFVPIQTFAWDQSDNFVSVYVSESMDSVKASGAKVNCNFTEDSFDLTVQG